MPSDEHWMRLALEEAQAAADAGEIPVGAVLVKDDRLIARGRNSSIASKDASAHAEVDAMRAGGAMLGNYRLDGCTLYVTLEPCAMCAGAALHARLQRVVYGARDPKTGAAGSVVDLFGEQRLNHRTQVRADVLAEECAHLLHAFFQARRLAAREGSSPLRDDALRTPEARFAGLADLPAEGRFVSDLPLLRGWRMHALDSGPDDSAATVLCLHGPGEWGYFFRHLVPFAGHRVLVPDLIGFGRSDKPKRSQVHSLAWHADVLVQWLDHLQAGPIALVHSARAAPLAMLVAARRRTSFAAILEAPDSGEPVAAAWRAPFPDAGHEAALRALGGIDIGVSGPGPRDAGRVVEAAASAMGYCRP